MVKNDLGKGNNNINNKSFRHLLETNSILPIDINPLGV